MKAIPLFYWSSIVFENKAKENYGDLLSAYIVEAISKKEVRFYNAPKIRKSWFSKKRAYLMAIGSIMSYTQPKAKVWGSGIIARKIEFDNAQFCAVRGPLSRKRVLELGYTCPKIYGDPALLLPHFYKGDIKKTHKIGIIPHYVDYDTIIDWYSDDSHVKVIDLLTDDILQTTDEILACDRIISSSLHGVIVAQAYGIPAVWVRFSDKLSGDNVKFEDYFLSVGLPAYEGEMINKKPSDANVDVLFSSYEHKLDQNKLIQLQENLINAFPEL